MTPEQHRQAIFTRIRQELARWDGVTGEFYWLSFKDPDRPPGERFLGVCLVRAPSAHTAIVVAHLRRCNPGGEVAVVPLSTERHIPEHWLYRVLTKEQAHEFDREVLRGSEKSGTVQ